MFLESQSSFRRSWRSLSPKRARPLALQTCWNTPPFWQADPYAEASFLFCGWRRRWWIGQKIDSLKLIIWKESPVRRSFPSSYSADVQWRRWYGGKVWRHRWWALSLSSDCGVVSCTTVVVARMLNGLGGRFGLLILGGTRDVCLPSPSGIVASFKLEPSVILFGSGKATDDVRFVSII